MTYPDETVSHFLIEHLVPLRIRLDERADQEHFRAFQVIWTPTLAFLDRRGVCHYQAPGFLPAGEFLSLLRIGLARSLMAWSRYEEAARHLQDAAASENSLAAEALFWLGMARYLPTRRRADLMRAWGELRERYPGTVWAARIPPGQEQEE